MDGVPRAPQHYDGSLHSYMDDFINKVAFGLNLVLSNGIGYPQHPARSPGGPSRERRVSRARPRPAA